MAILIPGIEVGAPQILRDRSMKYIFYGPELPPTKMTEVFMMTGKVGIMALSLEDITIAELEAVDEAVSGLGDHRTSPKERLQKAIYARWANDSSLKTLHGDYEAFYKHEMERFISEVKSKINNNSF
jgi:hypothetical protein